MATRWFDNYPLSQPYDWYFDNWFWASAPKSWEFFGGAPINFAVTAQDCSGVSLSWDMPWLWHLSWSTDVLQNHYMALGFEIVVFNTQEPQPNLLNVEAVHSEVIYRKRIYPTTVGPLFGALAAGGVILSDDYLKNFLGTTETHTIPRSAFSGVTGTVTIAIHGVVAVTEWFDPDETFLPWWIKYYSFLPKTWGRAYSTPFSTQDVALTIPTDLFCGGPGPDSDGDDIPDSTAIPPAAPQVSALRVNGRSNPDNLKSTDQIKFEFKLSDTDGPSFGYNLVVLDKRGVTIATVWDTGVVVAATGTDVGEISVSVPFAGPSALEPGVRYYWQVTAIDTDANTGDSQSSGNDYFQINGRPTLLEFTVNGETLLNTSETPTVPSDSVTLDWTYLDTQPQASYQLLVYSGNSLLSTIDGEDDASVILTNFLTLEAAGDYIVRLVVNDGIENSIEYSGFFSTNARPSVADLKIEDETNPTGVQTTTPTFSFRFLDSNSADTQATFRIQVASDDQFSTLLWDTGDVTQSAANGATVDVVYGTTVGPIVAAGALAHGVVYSVRVKVSDGVSYSDWTDASRSDFFVINTPPGDPALVQPTAGSYSGTLQIRWAAASPEDLDGDDIFYRLEITDLASADTGWRIFAGPIPSTQLTYELDLDAYPKGNNYAIRVISSDGLSESDPGNGGTSPRFAIQNHAPEIPLLDEPATGAVARKQLRTTWLEASPPDVDGDSVFYTLEITTNASDLSPSWKEVGNYNQGKADALIDISEFVAGADCRLRIKATDEDGAVSDYSYSGIFTVSNDIEVTAIERFGGNLYLGSSDGRVFRATESFWQMTADWSTGSVDRRLEEFLRGPAITVYNDGALQILPGSGSTYMLRERGKKAEANEHAAGEPQASASTGRTSQTFVYNEDGGLVLDDNGDPIVTEA